MSAPFAQMSYDEQRAFLGLGEGPPSGYTRYQMRVTTKAISRRLGRFAAAIQSLEKGLNQ